MEVYERIKDLRKNILCITQDEFAQKIHISRSNLSNIEIGRISVTPRVITDICNSFNVREEWLQTGNEPIWKCEDLSQQEKIMNYASSLIKGNDSIVSDAIKAFILTYAELNQKDRDLLEEIGRKYLDNFKRSE